MTKSEREWENWKALSDALIKSGAVTESDATSPVGARETSGQRLYAAIREWGDSFARLMMEEHSVNRVK